MIFCRPFVAGSALARYLPDYIGNFSVIACDKRKAFVQGSIATSQSILSSGREMDCFASLAMAALKRLGLPLAIPLFHHATDPTDWSDIPFHRSFHIAGNKFSFVEIAGRSRDHRA
jgi:hypothetical protein